MSVASRTSSSPSPARRSLGDKIASLGARLSRTLSHTDEQREVEDSFSEEPFPVVYTKPRHERSVSRGRDAFQSTGRGGAGNMRPASLSRDTRPDTGPDDFSVTRGREAISHPSNVFSTGRGGAGNLHSPSRERGRLAGPSVPATEQSVINSYTAAHEHALVSSGRGGRGNITSAATVAAGAREELRESVSRSRSRPPLRSTGRGGAGNILPTNALEEEHEDEGRQKGELEGA